MQTLPHSVEFNEPSITTLAQSASSYIIDHFSSCKTSIHLHSFSLIDSNLSGRAKLIKDRFLEHIKEKKRKLHSSFHETAVPTPDDLLVQLLLLENDRLFVSAHPLSYSQSFGWKLPLPFTNGVFDVSIDRSPPSRAYMKIDEAFAHLGRLPSPSSRIVELGASPGGWTYRLASIHHDIQVTTIDRAPLDPSLTKIYSPPRLSHVIADGAKWVPKESVDWVFSDMSIPCAKSSQVLMDWIENRRCERFVWTLKFSRADDRQAVVDRLSEALDASRSEYAIKHLVNQGNELIVWGETFSTERHSRK